MERRREPRVQPEGQIRVRILTPGQLETGMLVDLNNVGAFVATDLVLEKGVRVHVELDIPGIDDPMPLQAIVARCCGEIQGRKKTIPAGLGLIFVESTPEERQLIQQVVMSTLMLDLLSFGCKHQRLKENAKTHPHGVKVSKAVLAPDDASPGPT